MYVVVVVILVESSVVWMDHHEQWDHEQNVWALRGELTRAQITLMRDARKVILEAQSTYNFSCAGEERHHPQCRER